MAEFTDCDTCDGTGYISLSSVDTSTMLTPCPDCNEEIT